MRKLFKTDVDEFTPFSFSPIDFHLNFFYTPSVPFSRLLSQFKSLSDQDELNNEDGEKEIQCRFVRDLFFLALPLTLLQF